MDRLAKTPFVLLALLFLFQSPLPGQGTLVLEQLQPATSPGAPSGLNAPVVPLPNSIELQTLVKQQQNLTQNSNGGPMTIVPITQAVRPGETLRRGKLSVDDMIRRPMDASGLFVRVNADHSLDGAAPLAPDSRGHTFTDQSSDYWENLGYWWQSPAFCHKPLYFEQPCLERYGKLPTCTLLTPAASATKFFADFAVLPAKAIHQLPHSKVSTLGNGRPGDRCAANR